jgi:hypothetical protein
MMWHRSAFVQPLLQWKSNMFYIIWVCICSLSYPACNAHAQYYYLWPAWLYNIFPHYLINGTISNKTLSHIKAVVWFCLQLSSQNIFHFKEKWVRYDQNCISVCMLFLSYFNATLIFAPYFRKTFKHEILRKSAEWERNYCTWIDGQTDGMIWWS